MSSEKSKQQEDLARLTQEFKACKEVSNYYTGI